MGYPKPRLRGGGYDAFIEAFVQAVAAAYPRVVLQWEDFKQHNAIRLLDRYRHRLTSFNDDIQGTAAVVLAGILTALRNRGERLADQRLVLLGAGAAGIGIARLIEAYVRERENEPYPRSVLVMLDSRGLIYHGRAGVEPDKLPFALGQSDMARFGFVPADRYDLETVVRHVAPTVLIGTTGVAGSFTETAIREMAARVAAPIVMPLSNPTANAEATPSDVLAWTAGRGLVASGSPFAPVPVGGRRRMVGQANNVFIFPGFGLGAIASQPREITDRMFLAAAVRLAGAVSTDQFDQGALYPRLADLRKVSRAIAIAVATEAHRAGLARAGDPDRVEQDVDAAMWEPRYEPYR
jgi:malic enzyme